MSRGVTSGDTGRPSPDARMMRLRGVRVHNLKGIDLDLPLGRLIVVSGVSGSGKSSLAFETLFREGQRRYVESFSASSRRVLDRLERPDADELNGIPAAVAIRQFRQTGSERATCATLSEIDEYLRLLWARGGESRCPDCGRAIRAMEPGEGASQLVGRGDACKVQVAFPVRLAGDPARERVEIPALLDEWKRQGFQRVLVAGELFDLRDQSPEFIARCVPPVAEVLVIVDRLTTDPAKLSRLTEAIELAYAHGENRCVVLSEGVDPGGETLRLGGAEWTVLRWSSRRECGPCGREFPPLEPALLSFQSPAGRCPVCEGKGTVREGRRARGGVETRRLCPSCGGTRYSPEALACSWRGTTLAQIGARTVDEALDWFSVADVSSPSKAPSPVEQIALPEIRTRLESLSRLGLGYLELGRGADTLSGGELQRVRLTAALGCRLVETLYVLDEPSAGLHPRDVGRLVETLLALRDMGNTLVVVEHAEQVVRAADWLVDLGPGAGAEGGQVIFAGPPDQASTCPDSVTGRFLKRAKTLASSTSASGSVSPSGWIELTGVTHRNLQSIDVRIPLGLLSVVTGVSGAGKSSLVTETLFPAVAAKLGGARGPAGAHRSLTGEQGVTGVLLVDGSPPARSQRGNIATYLGIHDAIRRLLADSAEAKSRGYGPGQFSFNLAEGGRCPACEGTGTQSVDLLFLPDVTVACPECGGTRFRREVLEITYRGQNVAGILDLTIREAFPFFRGQVRIQRKLKLLREVGLDYLTLGQPLGSVSGGEAQRLKLARELADSSGERRLFLFEEPTLGLHPADVETLLACFRQLVSAGHSVTVIEHNRQVIAAADHVIDLGPGAGPAGGRVVYAGDVSGLLRCAASVTGQSLAAWLDESPERSHPVVG